MKRWVTEINAIDPRDGCMKRWCGPEVPGQTVEQAEQYCQDNGLGYCKVLGELIDEIPYSIAEHSMTLYIAREN